MYTAVYVIAFSFLFFQACMGSLTLSFDINTGKRYAATAFHEHDCPRPMDVDARFRGKTAEPDKESYHLYEVVNITSKYGDEDQHSFTTFWKCQGGNNPDSWECVSSDQIKGCDAPNVELHDMDQINDPTGFFYSQGSIIAFLYKMANNKELELLSVCDDGTWKMNIPEFAG